MRFSIFKLSSAIFIYDVVTNHVTIQSIKHLVLVLGMKAEPGCALTKPSVRLIIIRPLRVSADARFIFLT